MNVTASNEETLRAENAALRARLEEAQEMLRAIRAGEADALVLESSAGPKLCTLQGVDAEQNRIHGAMLAQVSDAVVTTDRDDRITFLNSGAEELYRVRRADVLGRNLNELYTRHWPSPEEEAAAWAALEERGHWCGEKLHRTSDGRELPVESSLAILHDPETGERSGWITAVRDITVRKQAEAALRLNTELFSKIIEQAPGGVYVVDAQFRVTQMNAESLPFFASVQPLIGRDFDEVLEIVWGPEIGPQCANIFRHTLATGERYVSSRFSERRHDTGMEQAFEWETQRITLPNGQHGVVCYFHDVTARERAEAELRLLNERFDLAVKCSRAVLWQQDLELRFTWLHNPAPGIDGSDAVGKRDEDLLERAEDTAVIVGLKREVIRSGVGVQQEFCPQIQGVRRCFEVMMEPLRDAAGLITGLTGAAIEITQLKRSEEARHEVERNYRALAVASSEIAYRMSADWSTLLPLDGRQLVASSGQPLDNWAWMDQNLPRNEHPRVRQAISEAIARKTFFEMEHRVRRADGSIGWTFSRAVPILDENQDVIAWFGVASDITDRKRIEEKLRETESRFIVALKNSRIIVYTANADLQYTWIHNSHQAFDPADILGRRDDELLSPEQAAPLIAIKRDVLNSGVGRRAEFAVEINGERAVYDLTVEPLRSETGVTVGVSVAAMDITDRKRAETVLKVSEVRYRRLFESAKDGILILTAHAATITHANPFIAELLGYSPEEMQGKELWQIGLFQDVEASKAAMQELQETGYIRYEDLPLETKAGRRINVEFVSNVYGEDGDAVIQCNIRDISDRKRLDESLRQRAADLSDADRRKDEFLATLAHELRNPLAPIRNGLQIMKLAGHDYRAVEKSRSMMERQVEQMTHLIDDLMDVSRINQGKVVLQKTRINLADAVQNAVDTSRPLIDAQGHELVVALPPEPVYVDGDLTRLSQVFANLLNNAAKYTNKGGRIRLAVERQGNEVLLSVEDNGVGISADKLSQVFDMFAQVDRSLEQSQGGLGIGLNIVKRLVEMHDGSVTVESGGNDRGSRFVVRLPVAPSVTVDQPDDSGGVLKVKPARRRILVVDDNVDGATTLAEMLKIMGNDTQTAFDGEEAVALTEAFRPDVVLMDIGMPKVNGYEACRRIRSQPWGQEIVIIAQTGWGQDEDKRKSQEAGFTFHMVKPIDFVILEKLLDGLSAT